MPSRIPFPRSIRARLFALILAVMLPLAGLIAFDYSAQRASRVELAGDSSRALAGTIAASLAQLIETERAMLAALAARPSQRVERPAVCDTLIAEARALNPYRANITVSAASGEPVCSAVPLPAGVPLSVIGQEHAQRLLRTGEFSIGEASKGPITGRWVVPLAFPRRDAAGRLIGWVGVPLDVERIGDLLSRGRTDPNDLITVISPQGKVIARSSDAAKWVGTDVLARPNVQSLLKGTISQWRSTGLDGTARVFGAAEVPIAGWKVVAGIDEAKVLAPANAALLRNILLLALMLVLTAALSYWISRGIAVPVQALAQTARSIASGERGSRAPATGVAEIAQVAAELNRMLDARERAETELRLANQRFALAASTGDVWEWDVASGVVSFPPQFWHRLGYADAEAAEPLKFFESILHPEDLARWRQAVEDHIVRRRPYDLEYRARTRSGEYRWFHTRGQAVWDESGRATHMAGTTFDITARKQAEADQQDLGRRIAAILEGMGDGFVAFDREWRYTNVNARAAELFGRSADSLVGRNYYAEYPEAAGTAFEQAYRRAMDERVPVFIEERYAAWDRWFENRIFPTADGIAVFFHEITERKRAEAKIGQQLDELRRWYDATLGREDRVRELKREVNGLQARLGEAPRYAESPADAARTQGGGR